MCFEEGGTMNLQERLLQNEIKHLGQIIQTLSYEFIVLQDFLKDEYGPKFEGFRTKYSCRSATGSSVNVGSQGSNNKRLKSSNPEKDDRRKLLQKEDTKNKVSEDEDEVSWVKSSGGNSSAPEDNLDELEEDNYYNHLSDSQDSETSVTLRDPLDIKLSDARKGKGGRRRTRIWKFFDTVMHSDNKYSARCHVCQGLVSARSVRMVEHRLKCKRKIHMKKDIKPDNRKEAQTRGIKLNINGEKSRQITDDEELHTSSDKDNNSGSISHDKTNRKCGRMLDTIWNYFEIVYQDSMKKAKCISCGQYISPKAVRMRQHKISCKGEGAAKTSDSE